ncbi:hypothetical protein Br6_05017 [Rhodococcus sp. Br-6]|nr:hypothetical protein Br6_05017 [Rhodococcus sp. Br-6]
MTERPWAAALGSLAGRAAGMPAQKPLRIDTDFRRDEYVDSVSVAAVELRDALRSEDAEAFFSTARCTIDSGGPFWSKLVDDLDELPRRARATALRRLPAVAERAAIEIADRAAKSQWVYIVSEFPLLNWSLGERRHPVHGRIDIIGWSARAVHIVDLKTVRWIPRQAIPEHARQVERYVEHLPVDDGLLVRASALYVDQDGSDARWLIVHPASSDN